MRNLPQDMFFDEWKFDDLEKKQNGFARTTTRTEFRTMTHVVCELL